ncbi:NRPS-like enzyme, putative [Talaromyces stipitatus ATCC 10500]|uniref:NRPS-like enzyme, putative n=1 Tax=Talaromyces stipitatus (strain ATCC 10500 / CBS 375.48 / QM 6759 / NRRL 1006) TaxID=441959 RepID=B8MLL1_TALSN|nr:NRPS-like enzyme, putative [Talaromyces stipitatus ATCC 10500]EED15544.1 NRPS-like enzyme, putative [Talaromyces stipitatus ATCC 10500]
MAFEHTKQLMPTLLEQGAKSTPDRVWAKFPISNTTYEHGFRTATYSQMLSAVNKVAWILDKSLGKNATFETLPYLGPSDLRYHIVLLAAIKTGYKAFFPSPRNSKVAQMDLLWKLECRLIMTTDPEPPFVSMILKDCLLTKLVIPSLDELLREEDVPPYPYTKSFEEAKDDPIFVLHTSGSTGIPKPMIYTHRFVSTVVAANTLPAPDGLRRVDDYFLKGEFFSFLPAFHIAGIGWGFILPFFSNSIPLFPLPGKPPSTEGFLSAVKHGEFHWAFLLPVILEELSKDTQALDLVASKLQYLFYTGGSLPHLPGEIILSRIPIFSGLGSSECSAFPQLIQTTSDGKEFTETWKYVSIHPAAGAEFRHRLDDQYELVIVKSATTHEAQPVFTVFPKLTEYETRDLFTPHPTLPNLWRHRGRRDDIVVFINGEKTNPISFEQEVLKHPEVRAALVGGNQRFEACLLIETIEPIEDGREFVDRIWPVVQEANGKCPAHARVDKSKILVLDTSKPMLRAGKGTVQRQGTLQLYADEINALYEQEKVSDPNTEPGNGLSGLTENDIANQLRHIVSEITSFQHFDDDMDFFALGMDSLHTLQLCRAIKARFRLDSTIAPSFVYKHPSLRLLAREILLLENPSGKNTQQDRLETMTTLLKHYEQQVDHIASKQQIKPESNSKPQVIILTGSTGAIGSHLLQELLSNPSITHIYCLNRSPDSESVQIRHNRQRGLPYSFPPERVTFLTVNLTKPAFNLEAKIYTQLIEKTTQIIHNAWPVNFNQSLASFQGSLDGVLGLISFAAEAKLAPSLLFLSSVSSMTGYTPSPDSNKIYIPEKVISDLTCPAAMGYGESKYLAERIIDYTATKLDASNFAIARIGQIAGTSQQGKYRSWRRDEWLPSLIVSSALLGSLPGELGVLDSVDWVPVDELGRIIVEASFSLLLQAEEETGARVFHCRNPRPVTWESLRSIIAQELTTSFPRSDTETKDMEIISLPEWTARLRASATSTETQTHLEQNPAVKLLDFYEQLASDTGTKEFSIKKTLEVSKALRELKSIQPEWIQGWIRDWVPMSHS